MVSKKIKVDALYVINQDVSFDWIHRNNKIMQISKMLVVTSHHLFPHELHALSLSAVTAEAVIDFCELLSDDELVGCDEKASKELVRYRGRWEFVALHQLRSLYLKNQLICSRLEQSWQFDTVYYSPGLGICEEFWSTATGGSENKFEGSEIRLRRFNPTSALKSATARISAKLRQLFTALAVDIVSQDDVTVFFISRTGRLMFGPSTAVVKRRISSRKMKSIDKFVDRYEGNKRKVIGTSIHEYDPWQTATSYPLEIFVDGYHPGNYPTTYLDAYPDGCYVVRDMFDDRWFRKNDKNTRKPYSFLACGTMAYPSALKTISRVYLMLNHAGNWSALINRADTDILVTCFAHLASKHPDVEMVIRTHPTMAKEDHEGLHSVERTKAFICSSNLPNLHHSTSSLEYDVSRADVIVTEYSNVILDGFREGILGLIVNLTGRRNFMQDFTDLGFLTAEDETSFDDLFTELLATPGKFCTLQAEAAARYNSLLENFLH